LPATFFCNYSAGDLAVRALDINTIYQTITGVTVSSVLSSVFSIFSFGLLFHYSVRLALIATLTMSVILGVAVTTSYPQGKCIAHPNVNLRSYEVVAEDGKVKVRL
jgi:ABC-type bacteriocin/lantibiotic exporter with double-glycine peptidase domain